ncbi:MAG: dihydrolipoyl dehydrogenase [Bdellovibrionaceae bacterium]|jgi:dihydrolipoamide dehydrogenase|nr:dihydrolipoyl dehydrogenase [Pseudobdellovibrionaceae bacterium]
MSQANNYDVCVVGSGPGGYVCAIKCAQLGLKTVIVEKEKMGGVCLNVGCIPSKAMISAAQFLHRAQHDASDMGIEIQGDIVVNLPKLKKWKDSVCDRMSMGVNQLLKGNKVDIIIGEADFFSEQEVEVKSSKGKEKIKAKNIVIATGSRPIEIPGFKIDEKSVLSSTGALDLEQLPKKMITIGGGYIGLEISTYLCKLGVEVEVLEAGPAMLSGVVDKDCVKVIERKLKKLGVKVHLNAFAKSVSKKGKSTEVVAEIKGKKETLIADKVLLTVGRKANSDQMNFKKAKVNIDSNGFIAIDKQCRTSNNKIFAIGDIAGQPMLAHKASHEGVLVAEVIHGANRVYDVKGVPAVIFTDPEIASMGMTEEECKQAGYEKLKVGKFPFAANGKAVSLMETDGFIKIIADHKTNVILGVHIVGPEASNLISEAALAVEMGATLEDLALTIHPHPTLGEAMMEAAEATLGHAIHMINRPIR